MSRDFDKAQEMVWASMEYVKVLGFRLRRTEVQRDDWKKVAQSHADELIKCRQQIDALKKERDGFFVQIQDMRAELDRLLAQLREEKQHGDKLWSELHELRKLRARAHPVKVGEWVRRTAGDSAGQIAQVLVVQSGQYEVQFDQYKVCWSFENCAPCDPPQEAFHDTPEGKLAAESVIRNDRKTEPDEIKVGDVAKVRSASGNLTAKCNVGQIGEVLKIDSRDGTVLLSGEAGWVDIQDVRKVTT